MPFPSTPFGDRSGLRRPGRLLRPLLTSASRSGRLAASSVLSDTVRISRGKPGVLRRAPAGFTVPALDGYGLRESLPARPANPASYPVSVRRAATSLHASFRRSLAVPPLRFARASPPSGCTGDFHPQDAGYARHTGRASRAAAGRLRPLTGSDLPPKRSHEFDGAVCAISAPVVVLRQEWEACGDMVGVK